MWRAMPNVLNGGLIGQGEQHDCKIVYGQPLEERRRSQALPESEEVQSQSQVASMDDIILKCTQRYDSY